tara:strand:- start:2738 stop:3478 length:741 start_codon:yes stop_codon:yes gene_type:complete
MKKTAKFTDKAYRLLGDSTPLSYMLPTRHTKRFPILHFDENTGVNRELRYSPNQKSIYVDEQDANVILEAIIFEDGLLQVRKTNQVLQQFLDKHPLKGKMFEEIDEERDAAEDVEILNQEVDALVEARSLSVEQLVEVGRVLFGNVSKKSTAEIRRDVLVFARTEPAEFLNIISDPQLKFTAQVQAFFDNGLLLKRGKDIYFNTKSNKKRMVVVPAGEDEIYIASSYLQSEEGEQAFKLLEKSLKN